MIIIYIDIILLCVLLLLVLFTCGFCVYRVHRLQQNGQVAILLRPTKVLFSHKREGEENEQLSILPGRTVVAYRNPFSGDYCVRSSARPHGYENQLAAASFTSAAAASAISAASSPDSGLSDDRYEPLGPPGGAAFSQLTQTIGNAIKPPNTPIYDNSLNKTWKWDYTEYQI